MNKLPFLFIAGFLAAFIWSGAVNDKIVLPNPPNSETENHTHEHVVELREEGFYPENLVVGFSDTVIFRNKRSVPFWPASNLHPTHLIYSEFDSKQSIEPGGEWRFVFDRLGEWRYHDHAAPYYTGTISVVEILGHHHDIPEGLNCENLAKVDPKDKEKCWDKILGDAVKTNGVKAALQAFKNLYTTDPEFAKFGCHWYAHRIGEEAYGEKSSDWTKNFPPEVSYCGYGFVHGFLEHHFREEKDTTEAKKLCDYLDKNLSDELPRIRLNCFHTIGHGFVDDPPPKKMWGNPNAVIENALKTCANVSPVNEEVKECYDGAFNTLVNFMLTNQYGFSLDKENPLGFCGTLPETYQYSCYYEFAQNLDLAGGRDFNKIAGFVKGFKDETIAAMIVNTAVAGLIPADINNNDFTAYIHGCRGFGENLTLHCIRGVVGGLMAHGEPQKEYVKTLNFCDSSILKDDEKNACYENASHAMKNIYPRGKVETICRTIENKYQVYCRYADD